MKQDKLPFMQFYPADWTQDVQVLSFEAKGVWIDLLCQMWVAPERGVLRWTLPQLMMFLRTDDLDHAEKILTELRSVARIFLKNSSENMVDPPLSLVEEITIKNRRMIRDEQRRQTRYDSQKRYREKDRDKEKIVKRSTKDRKKKKQDGYISEIRNQKSEKKYIKKRKIPIPKDFKISDRIKTLAKENGWPDPVGQFLSFKDHHLKKGDLFVDWEAAFRTWLRRGKEFALKDAPAPRQIKRLKDQMKGK
jgi:hypothetical protein